MSEITTGKLRPKTGTNGEAVKVSKLGEGFSYWRILIFTLTFVLGVISTMLLQNAVGAEAITFSTVGLVGILAAVGLSSAAIVLAIAGVTLGHVAQKEIKLRGEESYQLQNEVSMRTIDTLLKIQSQTGIHSN